MLDGLLVDLVPFGEAFLKHEHRWANSEAVFWASVGGRPIESQASIDRETREWHEERARKHPPEVDFGVLTKDGTPIGGFSLNRVVPHHRFGQLGATIGEPAYWGGGYGTDALLLIMDYGFDWLDLQRIFLWTMSPNVRVMRQMEKVGFRLEVRQREATWVDGQPADLLAYGMLREEWPGRAAMIARLGLQAKAPAPS